MTRRLQQLTPITSGDLRDTSIMLVKDNTTSTLGAYQDYVLTVGDFKQDLIRRSEAPADNPTIGQIARMIDDGVGGSALPVISGKFLTDIDESVVGIGNGTGYGVLRLSSSLTNTSGEGGGTAATPQAVRTLDINKPDTNGTETITGNWDFQKSVDFQSGLTATGTLDINGNINMTNGVFTGANSLGTLNIQSTTGGINLLPAGSSANQLQLGTNGNVTVNGVVIASDPTAPTHLTTRSYVDALETNLGNNLVHKTGVETISGQKTLNDVIFDGTFELNTDISGTFSTISKTNTGDINFNLSSGDITTNADIVTSSQVRSTAAAPVGSSDLTRKDYVDFGLGLKVDRAGDTMTGDLTIAGSGNSQLTIRPSSVNNDATLELSENTEQGTFIRYEGSDANNRTYFGTKLAGVEIPNFYLERGTGMTHFLQGPITQAVQRPEAGSLTRKDYVDGQVADIDANFVHRTGNVAETITGTKTFSINPIFANNDYIQSADGVDRIYFFQDDTTLFRSGTDTGAVFRFNNNSNNAIVSIEEGGNIGVTAPLPLVNAHLTRKDYVDGLITDLGTDSRLVHTTGNETIDGIKTFLQDIEIKESAPSVKLIEADNSNKEWKVEVNSGSLNLIESGVNVSLELEPNGRAIIRNPVSATGQYNTNDALTRKDYVDSQVSTKVSKSGDTMTGRLTINRSGDGVELLRFDTDRAWFFEQSGSGAGASLRLTSANTDKTFLVGGNDSPAALTVRVSNAATSQFVGLSYPRATNTVQQSIPEALTRKDYVDGLVSTVETDLTAHEALNTAHGSTPVNTSSTIVQRDASSRFSVTGVNLEADPTANNHAVRLSYLQNNYTTSTDIQNTYVDFLSTQSIAGKKTFTDNTGINLRGATPSTSGQVGDFRYNVDDDEFEGYYQGRWQPVGGSGGDSVVYQVLTDNSGQPTTPYQALKGRGYLINMTTLDFFYIKLPLNPEVGDRAEIGDYNGTVGVSNPIIIQSDAPIHGQSEDFIITSSNTVLKFSYIDAVQGWKIVDGIGEGQTGTASGITELWTGIAATVNDDMDLSKPYTDFDEIRLSISLDTNIIGTSSRTMTSFLTITMPVGLEHAYSLTGAGAGNSFLGVSVLDSDTLRLSTKISPDTWPRIGVIGVYGINY